ncbi:C39 family peptidase [Streptomyces sp. NPDC007095]|uniref:C39 family peptidase n=1 Tax=Streptomyces sp. NPDC007095 TaxID=3154482 RepID=UPI0015D624F3
MPYFSQWESPELVGEFVTGRRTGAEDPRWRDSGAESPESYEFWARRLCGVACLRMALSYWFGTAPNAFELAAECLDAGAYRVEGQQVEGLIYAPFVSYVVGRWPVSAESHPELPAEELGKLVGAGALPLLSVSSSIRTPETSPTHRGGHLVLAVGASDAAVYLHNPSGLPGVSQEFAEVAWDDFARFYAGRGVVLRRADGR